MEKLPPIAKVYEAWSAVADGRVKLHPDERRATVTSSNGEKEYTVSWDEDGAAYSSTTTPRTGRATRATPSSPCSWSGRLPLDRAAAEAFAHVDWTYLNERFKRDYAAAVAHVVAARGLDADRVEAAAQTAYDALAALDLAVKRGSVRPPRTKKA